METISIEILNPKARRLLNDLAELNLIAIKNTPSFKGLLEGLRKSENDIPSIEEITKEVEQVRKRRYAKKALGNHRYQFMD